MARKGWYVIPGVQDGDRTLEQQVKGLEDLDVRNHDVLECGCAEGLMSRWLFTSKGAQHVLGLDVVVEHIKEAKRQCAGLNVDVIVHDLNNLIYTDRQFGAYDTVMVLAVLHKLKFPKHTLAWLLRAAVTQIVVRLPPEHAPKIVDPRSGNVPIDVEAQILAAGFERTRVTEGHLNEWTGHYVRSA